MIYRMHPKAKIEKIQVAHPASNPVLGFLSKNNQCGRKGQDAIEDYSESGAEVQVLCLQIRKVVRGRRRNRAFRGYRCSGSQPPNLLWLRTPEALV